MSSTDDSPALPAIPTDSNAFMPYPVSTLSPPIIPNDLSSFKSRGISSIQRDLSRKLEEIKQEYERTIDHFNWNKLVYESGIHFDPVVGETYHLYQVGENRTLSMIDPSQWPHKHLASVTLNVDRQWQVESIGENVDTRELFGFV